MFSWILWRLCFKFSLRIFKIWFLVNRKLKVLLVLDEIWIFYKFQLIRTKKSKKLFEATLSVFLKLWNCCIYALTCHDTPLSCKFLNLYLEDKKSQKRKVFQNWFVSLVNDLLIIYYCQMHKTPLRSHVNVMSLCELSW